MNKDESITKVIFRKCKDNSIDALFPYMEVDRAGLYCGCYSHLGQHNSADYSYWISQTKPAISDEYADLKRELESIGYNLQVIKRKS